MKKIALIFIALFLAANTVFATETSVGKKSSSSTKIEKGATTSKSKEKAVEDAAAHGASLSVAQVFFPALAMLEDEGKPPFTDCKLITKPPRAAEVGYKYEMAPGVFDITLKDALDTKASTYGHVGEGTNEKIKKIELCMATYGAIIADSALYLKSKIPAGQKEDLISLAKLVAERTAKTGLRNPTIKRVYKKVIASNTPCRFNGSYNEFVCGENFLSLANMMLKQGNNYVLYGADNLFGYNISFHETHTDLAKTIQSIAVAEQKAISKTESLNMDITTKIKDENERK